MSLKDHMKLEDEEFNFQLKITSITQNADGTQVNATGSVGCLLYTSPSPRDRG